MKVYGHSFRRRFFHISVFTVICLFIFNIVRVSAETDFSVREIQQSEENPSVIAFVVSGTFLENDVVNLYTDGSFVKSKVIGGEDTGGTLITLGNISVDVFRNGMNSIVAKIERDGVEVSETPVFRLTIQEPLAAPDISASLDSGSVTVTVFSDFLREGDVVTVFLNGIDLLAGTAGADDASGGMMRFTDISGDLLSTGSNMFEAYIARGGRESERGQTVLSVEEEEEEEEVSPVGSGQCVSYVSSQTVTRSDASSRDRFGRMLSVAGDTLAVSADTGSVHIYRRDADGSWVSDAVIGDPEYRVVGSLNTVPVLDGGDRMILGVPHASARQYLSGAVRGYVRSGGEWVGSSVPVPADLPAYHSFGGHVGISDELLVVSSRGRDESGSVHVYSRDGGSWGSPVFLVPSDSVPDQYFGDSISVDGSRFAVGAPGEGAVYIYTEDRDGWSAEKLDFPAGDGFGSAVLLNGGRLFVGVPDDGERGRWAGSVRVYERSGSSWNVSDKILPDVGTGGRFGSSLAYRDGLLAVGAPGHGDAGAVYLYRGSDRTVLLPPDGGSGDSFGSSVAFDGSGLIIGAHGVDGEKVNTGAVYVFGMRTSPCSDASVTDTPVPVSGGDILNLLEEKQTVLERLTAHVSSVIRSLTEGIRQTKEQIADRTERVVVFDREVVPASAQRRAAEIRGIVGPGIPRETVAVTSVGAAEYVPPPSGQSSVRSCAAVISETRQSVGSAVPVSDLPLRTGDVDEDVCLLQAFLNENGYVVTRSGGGSPGREVSRFGALTERALRSFQLVNGISVTGVLDAGTRNAMLRYVSGF